MKQDTHKADDLLRPQLIAAIQRIPEQRFSTKRLIETLRSAPEGEAAYQQAFELFGGGGEWNEPAYQVLHGQVIAGLLRNSGAVKFAGFIHGMPDEDDGYSVPTWWQKVAPARTD